jgi:hypoxanthine phosphoribosyltransferase
MTSSGPVRHEILAWEDVDKLIDVLVPQINSAPTFDAMLIVTRGGIIPGGLLAEALDVRDVLTASVNFPSEPDSTRLLALPRFLQFPSDVLLEGRRIMVVDDVWGSGRTSTAVRGRVEAAGGEVATCVLHYNPYRSLFTRAEPDFYGAVTDAYIVYPWELDRGMRGIELGTPQDS